MGQWASFHKEVGEEGDSCCPSMTWAWEEQTLQTCMTSGTANQVAVCRLQFVANDLVIIREKERKIKADEDTIQATQEIVKKKIQDHQDFNQPAAGVAFHKLVEDREIKEMKELIKKRQ